MLLRLLALSLQPALAVHGRECALAPPPPSGVCAASPAFIARHSPAWDL